MKTKLLRNVFRIDSAGLNNGFSQSKRHVRIVGVTPQKPLRKGVYVKPGLARVHPFEAGSKGVSQKTAEDGTSKLILKKVLR